MTDSSGLPGFLQIILCAYRDGENGSILGRISKRNNIFVAVNIFANHIAVFIFKPMSNVKEYKDIVAFHPGYYIADIIDDMEISQNEFATRMGTTAKTLSKLINGQANISNDLAKKLSVMLGTSVEVWQNLQNTYDQKLIEIQQVSMSAHV